jgi:Cu2+-exporting ATPase
LALAVPVVQVIATGRLFRSGVLLKSPTALERLADVDTVVFDKTGTLTEPVLALERGVGFDEQALKVAASLAVASRHPLARSLVAASGLVPMADEAVEVPGQGVRAGDVRLGSWGFAAADGRVELGHDGAEGPGLWLARPGAALVRFGFIEAMRVDAAATVERLRSLGLEVHLLSGDRGSVAASAAKGLGIDAWQAERTPVQKVAAVEALIAAGRRVLMVGDGLNDGPSLAAATVSASPTTAADVSQMVADVVFQGAKLAPVASAIETARRAHSVMQQNLALSIGYNLLMVPLAVAGFVTPWLAAAAMSSSSLIVMLNSFRLHGSTA